MVVKLDRRMADEKVDLKVVYLAVRMAGYSVVRTVDLMAGMTVALSEYFQVDKKAELMVVEMVVEMVLRLADWWVAS